jgi:DNA-binding phage protein
MKKTRPYQELLLESLADPEEASLYLKAVLEDYPEGLSKALGNVARAGEIAEGIEQQGSPATEL